ncbi:inorganic phosphate transporter [Clostridium sp. YIM B02506]|uniref:inorganic phosphate transporter n=1 Tax=Clostridium sp. YIM B02506 TaxID=2910680 RepID=UPI001EEE7BCA|nr:inorganic phosphate transporter [Clostridium sp. YIM B02506]
MLNSTQLITIIIVILALAFDFINGFHDTANAIASSVTTRALSPQKAILMSAGLNFIGALVSTKVATTIGSGIIHDGGAPIKVVLAAIIAAIIWNLVTWYVGIPSSSSHALIGGLIGASIAFSGSIHTVNWATFFIKVVLWLFLSPVIGFIFGYIVMTTINWIFRKTKPAKATKGFLKAQVLSAAFLAFNHGSNDAQKSMGIISLALFSGGVIGSFHVPLWVKLACATAMALGTSVGGWRIIKTMGSGMAKLTPASGFSADLTSSAVIFTATMMDAPVSTTHIVSTSIMGVSAAKRLSAVRWGVAKNIVTTWVVTIPSCALVGAIVSLIVNHI